MSLSLSITDLGNGAGATATIAGSDSGSANAVSVQQVSGGTNPSSGTWTPAGSRTGDGTLALGLVPAYYWAYCAGTVGGAPALSNLVYFAATDATLAVMSRLQAAIVAQLQTLMMANTPNARVYASMIPNPQNMALPCIFVTFEEEQEEVRSTVNGKDDIGYPFRIQIADRNSQDYVAPMPQYLLWRQQCMRRLRNQQFSTVPESLVNTVKPLKVIGFRQLGDTRQYQLLIVPFRLICWSREVRG